MPHASTTALIAAVQTPSHLSFGALQSQQGAATDACATWLAQIREWKTLAITAMREETDEQTRTAIGPILNHLRKLEQLIIRMQEVGHEMEEWRRGTVRVWQTFQAVIGGP